MNHGTNGPPYYILWKLLEIFWIANNISIDHGKTDRDILKTSYIYAKASVKDSTRCLMFSRAQKISEVKPEHLDDDTEEVYHPNQLSIRCVVKILILDQLYLSVVVQTQSLNCSTNSETHKNDIYKIRRRN